MREARATIQLRREPAATEKGNRVKILQVLPDLSAGGAEGFITNLGVSLAKLGADVRFFLMVGARGERGHVLLSRLEQAGIEVIGAEEHNVCSPMNIVRLVSLIRSWRPDIVQANMYTAEVLVAVARLLSIGSGARFVRRLSGTKICGCSHRSPTLVRLMDSFFCLTIACSPAVSKAYLDFMGAKSRSTLVMIPNGGLLQKTVTSTEEKLQARKRLSIPMSAFIVVHIGRMLGGAIGTGIESEPKAQDVLLKAFAQAFNASPDYLLVLVGDGPLRHQVETLAKSLGIGERTRFLGQLPEPWPVLKAADMLCFPSRHEGLPNVLPEAASCGLPVVASDIPEIRSLSPNGVWLLKPVDNVEAFANGLHEVAANYSDWKSRAMDAAPLIREQFSMTTCAKCYIESYNSLCYTHPE